MATKVQKIENAATKGDIVVIDRVRSSTKVHGETTRTAFCTITRVAATYRDGRIKFVYDSWNGQLTPNSVEVPLWACHIVTANSKAAAALAQYVGQDFPSLEDVRALVG